MTWSIARSLSDSWRSCINQVTFQPINEHWERFTSYQSQSKNIRQYNYKRNDCGGSNSARNVSAARASTVDVRLCVNGALALGQQHLKPRWRSSDAGDDERSREHRLRPIPKMAKLILCLNENLFITSDKGGSTCLPVFVCLSVCLSVSKITQKRVHVFGWNVACQLGTWPNWLTFELDPDRS